MFKDVIREVTPLTQNDCFTIFSRKKSQFNFPLHTHTEVELNLILNAAGSQRVIGDHIQEIGNAELVLVGPNLPHAWFTHNCVNEEITEVTIQFEKDLFAEDFLFKNQLINIKRMFEDAKRGILFSEQTVRTIGPRILNLDKKFGFDSVLELFSILHDLSNGRNNRMLSDITFTKENYAFNSRRIERVFSYLHKNFSDKITLSDVSKIANMSEESFSRFVKVHTGYTYTENLTEIRLGHVSRMLIDTNFSVSEIAYKCGFQNLANFNRIFRERKSCTPKEFRKKYVGQRVFV